MAPRWLGLVDARRVILLEQFGQLVQQRHRTQRLAGLNLRLSLSRRHRFAPFYSGRVLRPLGIP